MLLPYEKSDLLSKDKHAIFHPSDEVWFQYRRTQLLKDKDNNIHFPMLNDIWNIIGGKDNTGIIKKANHIHCINKSGIPIVWRIAMSKCWIFGDSFQSSNYPLDKESWCDIICKKRG